MRNCSPITAGLCRALPGLLIILIFPLLSATTYSVPSVTVHGCGEDEIRMEKTGTRSYTIHAEGIRTDYVVTGNSKEQVATVSPMQYTQVTSGSFEITGLQTGSTTISIYWNSLPYGDEFADGTCEFIVRVAPEFINSTGDAPDAEPGDDKCDTGGLIARDDDEEIECTLRAAIMESNAAVGPDAYPYMIPVTDPGYDPASGGFVIPPGGALPTVTDQLALDGAAVGKRSGGLPVTSITVDGAGFVFEAGGASSVLSGHSIINAPGHGVEIKADGVHIRNNIIGTTPDGGPGVGSGGAGVYIMGSDNVIGGGDADRNVISGNAEYGVEVHGAGNDILGNWIGLGPEGTTALGNGMGGVALLEGEDNDVGGDTAAPGTAPGNVISGNSGGGSSGVVVRTNNNSIKGNLIGLDSSGENPLGNGQDGVTIEDANDNVIGDPDGEAGGNRIAHNGRDGVRITGESVGNAVMRNEIFENEELGIDLGGDGVSANDDGDGDESTNKMQNFPTITLRKHEGGSTRVEGYLSSMPGTSYRLEFFATEDADDSGYGEADEFLERHKVTTDGEGRASFTFVFPGENERVVATATDPDNNTSEISRSVLVVNTVSDAGDATLDDGLCDTGGQVGGAKECSLRAAIQVANRLLGPDFIIFDIPAGPTSVHVNSALPMVSQEVTIDATTQDGFTPAFFTVSVVGPGGGGPGLRISAADAVVRGLTISDFDDSGIEYTGGGELELSHVELLRNGQNGLSADADVRVTMTEETDEPLVRATANGRSGLHLGFGARLSAEGRLRASQNGTSFSRPDCASVGGIVAMGEVDVKDVEVEDNCGYWLWAFDDLAAAEDVRIDGDLIARNNARRGVSVDGLLVVSGGFVEVEGSGWQGIHVGRTIEISGEPEGGGEFGIRIVDNGLEGIYGYGDITLSGPALIEGNGFDKPANYPCLQNRFGALFSDEGGVTTEDITIRENCGSGIISDQDITINGNATVTDNGGSLGIWANGSILLDGQAHELSRNGDDGIWSAESARRPGDGTIRVRGKLTAVGNGTAISAEECTTRGDVNGLGVVTSEGPIMLEEVEIRNNCHAAIHGDREVTINGNARITGNKGSGIVAGDILELLGALHLIADNESAGIDMFQRSTTSPRLGRITGHLIVRNNSTWQRENDDDECEFVTGIGGVVSPHVPLVIDRLTTVGNCGNGVEGSHVTVSGNIRANENTAVGVVSRSALHLNTGEICDNEAYGVVAATVNIGSVKVCNNDQGGIALLQGGGGKKSASTSNAADRSVVSGASIEGNLGDGILTEGRSLVVTGSNISGNTGFGISSADGSPVVTATGNWWGDASGPGGSGPGMGDGVTDGVEASSWEDEAIGLGLRSAQRHARNRSHARSRCAARQCGNDERDPRLGLLDNRCNSVGRRLHSRHDVRAFPEVYRRFAGYDGSDARRDRTIQRDRP